MHNLFLRVQKISKGRAAHRIFMVAFYLIIVLAAAYIFYRRYPYALDNSNFYAEDGTIFARNIYEHGFLSSMKTLFNGYLIVGLYALEGIATVINHVVGHGFITFSKAIAVTSYLYLGFLCSLPWLLFRKKMGTWLALIAVLLLTLFPLGGGDYAVIGTIGGLKFSFFFLTAMLVLYRNDTEICRTAKQFIVVDSMLLLSVLTNFLCIVILPFTLLRYREKIIRAIKTSRMPSLGLQEYSLLLLGLLSLAYACAIYINGIPDLPNYPLADGPLRSQAVLPLMYRASVYGLLFPLATFPAGLTIVSLLLLCMWLTWRSRERAMLLLITIFIAINYFGFLANRPGVTTLYLRDELAGNSIMFFYAGTLLFTFGVMYGIRHWFADLRFSSKTVFTVIAVLFFFMVFYQAGDGKGSYAMYKALPTLGSELEAKCEAEPDTVHLQAYPVPGQVVVLSHDLACDYLQ